MPEPPPGLSWYYSALSQFQPRPFQWTRLKLGSNEVTMRACISFTTSYSCLDPLLSRPILHGSPKLLNVHALSHY